VTEPPQAVIGVTEATLSKNFPGLERLQERRGLPQNRDRPPSRLAKGVFVADSARSRDPRERMEASIAHEKARRKPDSWGYLRHSAGTYFGYLFWLFWLFWL